MQCSARLSLPSPPGPASDSPRVSFWRALRRLACGLVFLVVALAPARADERIQVKQATLSVADGAEPGVLLDAEFEFELPWALEDAVNRGVALYFVVDFELFRERWYWFDQRLVATSLTYRLTYSPLTRQYRLARGTLALPFDSLAEALATLRRIRGWKVIERDVLKPRDDYRAQLRMRLDTSQLPKPFQINAFTNRDWTLTSDWRNVAVTPELAR